MLFFWVLEIDLNLKCQLYWPFLSLPCFALNHILSIHLRSHLNYQYPVKKHENVYTALLVCYNRLCRVYVYVCAYVLCVCLCWSRDPIWLSVYAYMCVRVCISNRRSRVICIHVARVSRALSAVMFADIQ